MTSSAGEVLSRRALNRALLDRQLLLRRVTATPWAVVEHLVGLQAQAPLPPYLGLWARVEGFDPHALGRLLEEREVVRLALQRATVHLVTVRDALVLRPLVQVVVERLHQGAFGRRMGDADPAVLARMVRELLDEEPLTARELGRRLVERGVGHDVEAIGNAARAYVPLVQVPPRGIWGRGGQARYATLESWTGQEPEREPSIDEIVVRYLRAFGPASVRDVQAWCGLTRLRPVLERLRPRLVTFRDEHGVELFDLPDAPRPDVDARAPVRFLGEYDNVLLGHADRRRVIPEGYPWDAMLAHGRYVNNLLVDGMLRASWWVERDARRRATVAVRPFGALARVDRDEVADEATRVLEAMEPEVAHRDVRFEEPVGEAPARA